MDGRASRRTGHEFGGGRGDGVQLALAAGQLMQAISRSAVAGSAYGRVPNRARIFPCCGETGCATAADIMWA